MRADLACELHFTPFNASFARPRVLTLASKQVSKRPWIAIGLLLPLFAEDRSRQTVSSTQTAHFDLTAAGTIRLDNSFGEVDIDGWDKPEAQVTVVRSSERFYQSPDLPEWQHRLDSVKVTTRQEGNDVAVATTYPARSVFLHPLSRRSDVAIRYQIRAPRASKLIIEHNSGGVNISDIRGDIHVALRNGQINLTLIPGSYAIDAECTIGNVYSDFEGRERGRYLLGDRFAGPGATPAAGLYLRVRYGDIMILKHTGPAD